MKLNYATFCVAYDQWLAACLIEFNERFGECRKFVQIPEKPYNPDKVVEFAEDGTAYPHGSGGVNYIRNAVTPWEKSKFFVK